MITNLAGRAQAGGEKGVNGDHYKGGQYLPSTQAPKGSHAVMRAPDLDDAALAERAERKARQEAEIAEFQARCLEVAADPRTIWLASFLMGTYTRPGFQGLRGGDWYDEDYPGEYLNSATTRPARVFTSGFARSMHAELTRYGKLPGELPGRAYTILCEMYVKSHGARRGSKRYAALQDEFESSTLGEQ